jgi:hypothetical protein
VLLLGSWHNARPAWQAVSQADDPKYPPAHTTYQARVPNGPSVSAVTASQEALHRARGGG